MAAAEEEETARTPSGNRVGGGGGVGSPGGHPTSPPPPPPTPLRPASQSRLHNFRFPTSSWGSHRILRCAKIDRSLAAAASDSPTPPPVPKRERSPSSLPPSPSRDSKRRSLKESASASAAAAGEEDSSAAAAAAGEAARPWNLRMRRAACTAPSDAAPMADAKGEEGGGEATRRPFSASLSKEEIEIDFLQLRGSKPPRRPKKRPRNVQRFLDLLVPGSCLAEVTKELYG